MKTKLAILLPAATLFAGLSHAVAFDDCWPQFLGTGSRAISTNANLPDHWSATENVAWKTPIPGRGWSSPIVWGDRVFLTTVLGGEEEQTPKKGFYTGGERTEAPSSEFQWKLLCLDLLTGKVRWERTVYRGEPSVPKHVKNSYASETPVTDGERVYAYFGNLGVYCYDVDGCPVWSKTLKPHATRYGWGTAASPVLHGDRLYLVNDNEEKSYLLALDKHTGKEVWSVDRDDKSNWATPYVWESEKRTEIVTPGTRTVRAYDPQGKVLWSLNGMATVGVATPYVDGGLLYVSSSFVGDKQQPVFAIRAGASGDISLAAGQTSNSAIAWSNSAAAPFGPTSLVYGGRLYVLYDRGTFGAMDAQTGKRFYKPQKLPNGKQFTASPWAYNGRVFCLNEDGLAFVVRAGEKFELLGTNKLADDDMCMASPALAGDRLLIRTSARLYCIQKKMK